MPTKTTEYGTSIQLWPRGQSLLYKGDPHGPTLRIRSDGRARWRKPSAEERHALRVELTASRIMDQGLYCCDSCLVDDALRLAYNSDAGDFGREWEPENIKNLRPDPSDWTLEQCREWLDDKGHGHPDPDPWGMSRDDLLEALSMGSEDGEEGSAVHPDTTEELRARLIESIADESVDGLDDWREAVRDNAEDEEVYEWYRVSSWLAGKLEEVGEVVLDNAYGYWWGRTCTGQQAVMDGTFQKVAALIEGK